MRVFLHIKARSAVAEWENLPREFARVPCVGEYVTTAIDSPMYRIVGVVHCAFAEQDGADYAAEVYAVKDDRAQHDIIADLAEAGSADR